MNQILRQRSTRLPALYEQASAGERCVLRWVHRCCDPPNISAALFISADASALIGSEASPATSIGVLTRLPLPQSP
jgi:hypothetical protein